MRHTITRIVMSAVLLLGLHACTSSISTDKESISPVSAYLADGRLPLLDLYAHIDSGLNEEWVRESIYSYQDSPALAIRSWRTRKAGAALWLLSGLHGEEPAGPNAIARNVSFIKAAADAGIPIVLVPVGNPKGYRNNWRYPNTSERNWRKGGYSVGDSEYLLPDLNEGSRPRVTQSPGPEATALTQFVLDIARDYPPQLVLDLHEDELSTAGGYIYSQGIQAEANRVGAEVVRILQAAGIPLRMEGKTRFDEPIRAGIISRDDQGNPIRDGSIDELLAARDVFVNARKQPGPAAKTVIVVETPAFAGARLDWRVKAQADVLKQLEALWRLSGATKSL